MSASQTKTSAQGVNYKWSKDFMEVGKKRFAGDTMRSANSHEVLGLRGKTCDLKKVLAEQTILSPIISNRHDKSSRVKLLHQ